MIKIGCSEFHEEDLLRCRERKNFTLYESNGECSKARLVDFHSDHFYVGVFKLSYNLLYAKLEDLNGLSYGAFMDRFEYE